MSEQNDKKAKKGPLPPSTSSTPTKEEAIHPKKKSNILQSVFLGKFR
jgi:hypothetical protein